MRRRPRLGDLALLCAIALLAVSANATLHTAAKARSAALVAFARDTAGRPGVLSNPAYRRAYRVAAVCALHRPSAALPPTFRLCGVMSRNHGFTFVRRFYRCKLGTRCAPPSRLPRAVTQ